MPGSSYELYYPHMMPICARDDSYGSVMRIIGMSVCLRCRAGFGCLPRSRATFGRSAPSTRPNLARELSDCPKVAQQRCECPKVARALRRCPEVARQRRACPNLARERPAIEHRARTRAPLTVPFGPLAERLWQNERRREKIRAQP